MKILLTGSSGFLGGYIKDALINHDLHTLGRDLDCDYKVDVLKNVPEISEKYDLVIHAIGLAHRIANNSDERKLFYAINFEGTKKIVKSLKCIPKNHLFL